MNTFAQSIANQNDIITAVTRRDIREASKTLTDAEARFLVDLYYIAQRERIRFNNQVRSMTASKEPVLMLDLLGKQSHLREEFIKKSLDDFTKHNDVGVWLRSIHGIGPVTSAGLLAHIDITKAPTAGAIWKFAGIDGASVWNKGEKRPWNATLKTLFYKIGESFVKTSNSDKSFYGKLYKQRKEMETAKNLRGDFAEQAARELTSKNYSKGTITHTALIAGKLSDGHIHARARRYAVKIFASHLHHVMYNVILKKDPPVPFAIAILNHAHMLQVPNKEFIKDFVEPLSDDIDNDSTFEDDI